MHGAVLSTCKILKPNWADETSKNVAHGQESLFQILLYDSDDKAICGGDFAVLLNCLSVIRLRTLQQLVMSLICLRGLILFATKLSM